MYHLAESVYEHKNTIILVSVFGKPKTKSIETDFQYSAGIGRGCSGARDEGLGFTRWHTSKSTNVLAHKLILAGPVKVATYREISLLTPTMPTSWCIVSLIQYAQAQIIISGDDNTRCVTGNGCII